MHISFEHLVCILEIHVHYLQNYMNLYISFKIYIDVLIVARPAAYITPVTFDILWKIRIYFDYKNTFGQ